MISSINHYIHLCIKIIVHFYICAITFAEALYLRAVFLVTILNDDAPSRVLEKSCPSWSKSQELYKKYNAIFFEYTLIIIIILFCSVNFITNILLNLHFPKSFTLSIMANSCEIYEIACIYLHQSLLKFAKVSLRMIAYVKLIRDQFVQMPVRCPVICSNENSSRFICVDKRVTRRVNR